MGRYNSFFASNDSLPTKIYNISIAATATFTPAAQGVSIPVASATYTQYNGLTVQIAESGLATWYGTMTHQVDATHIYVVPLQSALDSGSPIGVAYKSGATACTVTNDYHPHVTLSIDLSDAPDGTYNYILVGSCSVSSNGSSSADIIRPALLQMCAPGDHLSYDAIRFQSRYHFTNGSYTASRETLEDTYIYNIVHSVNLTAGNTYEFHIAGSSTGGTTDTMYMRNGKLVAFRVGTFQEKDNSTDATGVSSSAGSWVTNAANQLTIATTDNYMLLWCGLGHHGSTTLGGCQLRFNVGGTIYSDVTFLPVATTDAYSFAGWITVNGLTATTVCSLEVNNNGSNTATLDRSYICAIPLSSQSGYGFDYTNMISDDKRTDTNSSAALSWARGRTSASQTLLDRNYIEIINCNARKATLDKRAFARPVFKDGLPSAVTERGYVGPGIAEWHGIWLARTKGYLAGTTANGIDTRAAVNDGALVKVKDAWFLWLPDYDDGVPDETTPTTVIADIESGLQFKSWNAYPSATGTYFRQISEINLVSRILRNSAELTLLTSLPANSSAWNSTATDSYYWDAPNQTIYIKTPSSPSADDQTVLVVALDTYGRTSEVLYDTAGTLYPYESRLQKVPGLQQEVQARGTDNQVSSTLGSITLPASDGAFDTKIRRRIYEGLRATIRRGYSSLSQSLDTFHVIAKGIMAMPILNEDKMEIKLMDTGVILNRALDDTTITVYHGASQADGQPLPIIYGTLKRVPAYRITDVIGSGTAKNVFKIASHYLKSIDALYADGTTGQQGAFGTKWPASAAFEGVAFNASPNTGWNADIVYVDCTGHTIDSVYTGTLLTKPGEICKHLVQNYPRVKTDQTGGFLNTTASSFTQTAAVFDITVASNASFNIGDIIKARDGVNSFHAYVYAKPSGKLSCATLYYTNDTAVPFSYSSSTIIDQVDKAGGLANTKINVESFRQVDRKWRKKISGGLLVKKSTPTIGALLTGTDSISASLNKISGYAFIYWYVNRLGRIALGVTDFDASNLIDNPGFEMFSSSAIVAPGGYWPFDSFNNVDGRTAQGTLTLVSSKRYEGLNCLKLDNKTGSFEGNPNARAIIPIVLPTPGMYAVTLLTALDAGNGQAVRVTLSGPDNSRSGSKSDAIAAASDQWQRVTTYIDTGVGNSGTAFLRIHPYDPDPISPPMITGTNLLYWYKADEPLAGYDLPKDNDLISTWYNKGTVGSGGNMFAFNGPTWVADYCMGRPAIALNSVGDQLFTTSASMTSQYTVFIVYALNDTYTGGRRIAFQGLGAGGDELDIGVESGVTNYNVRAVDTTTHTSPGETITANVNTLKIHTVRVSASSLQYWINSVQQATTLTELPDMTTLFGVGHTTQPLNGVVCELMIYDKSLGGSNRKSVENYLARKYGIDAASIFIDNIEVSRIAGVIDDVNSDYLPLEFRDEIYPEVRVAYNVNLQSSDTSPAIIISDSTAKGLTTTISEGKNAIQTSARLDLGLPTIADSPSASGIGAAIVAYFGRLRYFIKVQMVCPYNFVPDVGMKLLSVNMARLPIINDGYPLFPITMVDYNQDNAIQLDMEVEGQVDPVLDRGSIAQDTMPLGAVLVTLDTGTLAYVTSGQFEEVEEMFDKFIAGSATANLGNEYGDIYHTHTLQHKHNIGAHSHPHTIDSIGIESLIYDDVHAKDIFGISTNAARGIDNGSHTHTGTGSGYTTGTTSGTSSNPTTTLTTIPGPVLPSFIRTRFLRLISDAPVVGNPLYPGPPSIPTTVYFGFETSPPTGWTRNTAFNGFYLRGATTNTAIVASTPATALASAFTPTDTGSFLSLVTLADIQKMSRGKRLTVINTTSGTKTYHLVVDTIDEANKRVWVYPLHESVTPDSVNATLPATTLTTVAADTEIAGTTFTAVVHDHGSTVPSHVHTADHSHSISVSFFTGGPSATVLIIDGANKIFANTIHTHSFTTGSTPSTPGGTILSAGGTAISSVTTQPDGYGLIWASSPSSNRVIPTGAIIFFDGAACPNGYTRFSQADDLLIYGSSGSTSVAVNGGHAHTFTANSHTFNHNHGGTVQLTTDGQTDLTDAVGGTNDESSSVGNAASFGHAHNAQVTFTAATPNLDQNALVASSAASQKNPLHRKLLLCKKD